MTQLTDPELIGHGAAQQTPVVMEGRRSKHGPDLWAQNNQPEGYPRKTSTHIKPPMIDEKKEHKNNGRMGYLREAAKGG